MVGSFNFQPAQLIGRLTKIVKRLRTQSWSYSSTVPLHQTITWSSELFMIYRVTPWHWQWTNFICTLYILYVLGGARMLPVLLVSFLLSTNMGVVFFTYVKRKVEKRREVLLQMPGRRTGQFLELFYMNNSELLRWISHGPLAQS